MGKLDLIESKMHLIREIEALSGDYMLKTVHYYRDIAQKYNAYIITKCTKCEAITWVSDDFDISESTVRRALKFFDMR